MLSSAHTIRDGRYIKKFKRLSTQRKSRVEDTERKLTSALLEANTPADLPHPLNKPSHTKPYRRAKADRDIRIYWKIIKKILVFYDICTHKEARQYRD